MDRQVYLLGATYVGIVENQKLKLIIEAEVEVYLGQIKDLTAQGDTTDARPHGAKLNYCHGRFEGLQWVLSKISQ